MFRRYVFSHKLFSKPTFLCSTLSSSSRFSIMLLVFCRLEKKLVVRFNSIYAFVIIVWSLHPLLLLFVVACNVFMTGRAIFLWRLWLQCRCSGNRLFHFLALCSLKSSPIPSKLQIGFHASPTEYRKEYSTLLTNVFFHKITQTSLPPFWRSTFSFFCLCFVFRFTCDASCNLIGHFSRRQGGGNILTSMLKNCTIFCKQRIGKIN